MKKTLLTITFLLALSCINMWAWKGMDMPRLKVQGRYLTDQQGNVVNLHGFAQTYSPWFNEQGSKWSNYDVNACLKYNKEKIDQIMSAGWEMSFLRLHMDPYWSNTPGQQTTGENDISAFSMTRFQKYLDQVFIPMAEYAISHGMYVVMRPPGVCPEKIAVGDAYQKYLIDVWSYVASHPKLKNHPQIMFELANEPVQILGTDGTYGSGTQAHFDALKDYFQAIVDAMRAKGAGNILWVPGLGYQSQYSGYANNPIEGENIGYAVHIYPGWFGSANGYDVFQKGWDNDVKPIADLAPIMVTEMDWADESYNKSWGKGHTGVAGGDGFGANFKYITDQSGNVSWLLFTGAELLAQFKDEAGTPGNYTFLNDPEACPWPIYHWYQDYKKENFPHKEYAYQSVSDNGDGTFSNPVIYGDFPDPDVVRVGDTYYMVSTTMHIFPGATILKSKDLVNWEYCANPLWSVENSDAYCLLDGNRYAQGQWASALQYRDGVFYLMFNTNSEGSYLLTTTDPEGTWEKQKLPNGYYDCGLLLDDDGSTYVVYGINELHVSKLDEEFNRLRDEKVITYTLRSGLEGSHMYHIGDYYYVYSTYGGIPGAQVVFRSKDPFGPYEEKVILNDSQSIHQGALVQTQNGEWWTMLMRDCWPYGRLPYLMPVSWEDGWPVISDGGTSYAKYTKPDLPGNCASALPTNDAFRHYQLGKQWGWNHLSDDKNWSLVERAGFMRLHTATVTDDFYKARNTLTQRMLGYQSDLDHSYATIAIDLTNMAEGDRVGLAAMQDPYACVGVMMKDGKRQFYYESASLTSKIAKETIAGNLAEATTVYLRGVASFKTGKVKFYASIDNIAFSQVGKEFDMVYDLTVFTGNKWAIFNYATASLGGYVDVDWFSTEPYYSENSYLDDNFQGYTAESLTLSHLRAPADEVLLLTGSEAAIDIVAVYMDGHEENVTLTADYAVSDQSVISVKNGRIKALKDGNATLTVSYTGPMGEPCTVAIRVEATAFPLTAKYFNPSIWESGTFDEITHRVTVGQYGFAGWQYSSGLDLSGYKYLVTKFSNRDNKNGDGISMRLFDQNNYWTSPATYEPGSNMHCVAPLQEMKNDKGERIDPSHLYIIGYWSYGGEKNGFEIETVYVTNSDDYLTAIDDIEADNADALVDVYTLSGIRVLSGVTRAQAAAVLEPGIYIIGGQKVLISRSHLR